MQQCRSAHGSSLGMNGMRRLQMPVVADCASQSAGSSLGSTPDGPGLLGSKPKGCALPLLTVAQS